jgi:hypothetical protein
MALLKDTSFQKTGQRSLILDRNSNSLYEIHKIQVKSFTFNRLANDIGRGTFSIRQITGHFLRSCNRLTMLIGIHFKRMTDYENGRTSEKPAKLTTVLGTVVQLGKGVLEHREYVKETWERMKESGEDGMEGIGNVGSVHEVFEESGKKRKRSSEELDQLELEFVVEESEEDSELDEVELILKKGMGKGRKRQK